VLVKPANTFKIRAIHSDWRVNGEVAGCFDEVSVDSRSFKHVIYFVL